MEEQRNGEKYDIKSEVKISIIIPIYNAEKYLKKCLNSVIGQTYQNLEIIAVDDGSTDLSGAICDQYAQKDSRIYVIHKQRGGVCSARNAGLDVATGECIAFIDNDDFIWLEMYEQLLNNMIIYDAEISMCSYMLYYGNEITVPEKKKEVKILKNIDALKILHTNERIDMIVPWNKLYKKELFEGIRYPIERIFDDEFVTYRLLWKARKICFSNQKFYYFRQREDSVTHTLILKKYTDYLDALIERNHFFRTEVLDNMLTEEDNRFCMEELCNIHFRTDCPKEQKRYYHQKYIEFYSQCNLKKELPFIKRCRYWACAYFPYAVQAIWRLKKSIKKRKTS